MEIAGKVFIVTGGASGLGEGTARMLAANGAKVVIADADPEAAAALVTSANVSETAKRHNFTTGGRVNQPSRARHVSEHFDQRVGEGPLAPLCFA